VGHASARSRRRPHWWVLTVLLVGLGLYAVAAPGDPAGGGPALPAAEVDGLAVHFLDVGQGDATLLLAPDAVMLIDTGRHDAEDLVPHLRRLGVERLDVVAVTHPHADHLGQFDLVLDTFEVGEVWWSGATHTTRTFERALAAVERSDAAYEEPRAGAETTVGSLHVQVLHPEELVDDPHGDSLVLRVRFGEISFLFTGDAEAAVEERMVQRFGDGLASTVYQVGHHGSSTSTSPAFLAAVSPTVAVYSAGADNPYGHPHAEVVEELVQAGVDLYGTDVHGTIAVTVPRQGTSYEIHPQHAEAPVDR
jgi:competence protein ComEC